MSLITIQNLTFGYDGSPDNVFENVDLQLDTQWKLGLIGRNGRGKTTLLRLLEGRYDYSGQIQAGVDFVYFPWQPRDRTAPAGQAALEAAEGAEEWRLLRELNLLKVPEEALVRPFDTLSGGEQTKILIAALFLRPGAFPLIDEPTNHLDALGRRRLADYLRGKGGFILASHDRALLDGCADHILSVNRRSVQVQAGNYSAWKLNWDRQDAFEKEKNQKLKKEIRQLEQAARQTAGWSDAAERSKKGSRNSGLRPDRGYIGHKSAKMMQRAKNIQRRQERQIEEKASLLQDAELEASLTLRPLACAKPRLIQARNLVLYQEGRPVCRPLDFALEPEDRAALTGPNGAGKTTLLRLCAGQTVEYTGEFYRAPGLELAVVPQDTGKLRGDLRRLARDQGADESLLMALLRKLGLERKDLERPIEQMSEGQRKKTVLALSFCKSAHLYLWDEPLNYIDLASRLQLEEAVLESRPSMLLVEHDAAFIQTAATKIIQVEPADR